MWRIKLSMLVSCFVFCSSANALIPLEHLVLGDFSKAFDREISTPIDYIYQQSRDKDGLSDRSSIRHAQLYRGFYENGFLLDASCPEQNELVYTASWQRTQALRSAYATLQYIGLDVVIRALASYAHFFEFSREEYLRFIDNHIGNFCSQNLTVISKHQLRLNMQRHFDKTESLYNLPDITNNKLLPSSLKGQIALEEIRKREFAQTIRLFKSFCSWGNDVDNLRLLIPLIRNPQIMAFIFRQLDSERLDWNHDLSRLVIRNHPDSVKVLCRGLICRREQETNFRREFPRAIGSISIGNDMSRLYCNEMLNKDFQVQNQDPKIRSIIDRWTFDEQNIMTSHFISLITGVPDLFIWSQDFSSGKKFLRFSIDESWNRWAKEQVSDLNHNIFYEEPLTLELLDRSLYFNRISGPVSVEFDLNMGEYDRIYQRSGKLTVEFDLKLTRALLKWAREVYLNSPIERDDIRDNVEERLYRVISPQVERAQERFEFAPWEGDLTSILVDEILTQLMLMPNFVVDRWGNELLDIPIRMHYGPFALKYIRHLRLVRDEKKRRSEIIETIEGLSSDPDLVP